MDRPEVVNWSNQGRAALRIASITPRLVPLAPLLVRPTISGTSTARCRSLPAMKRGPGPQSRRTVPAMHQHRRWVGLGVRGDHVDNLPGRAVQRRSLRVGHGTVFTVSSSVGRVVLIDDAGGHKIDQSLTGGQVVGDVLADGWLDDLHSGGLAVEQLGDLGGVPDGPARRGRRQ